MPREAEIERSTPASPASRVVAVADGVDRVVAMLCKAIVLITVILLLAVLGMNVVLRYALAHGGLAWASEIPEQLFPWLIAAGIVLAVQHGAHIAVDILLQALGRSGQRFLIIVINLIITVA